MAKKGKGFLGAIGSFFGSIPVVKKVVKTGKRMWKGIKKKGKQLFKFFKKFMKKLGKLYTKARKKARKLKKWAIRWGKRTWKAGVLWLKNTAQKGARWVKQKSKQVYQKTKQVYHQTKQQVKQVYQQTKQAVNVVKTAAKEVVKTYKAVGKGQFDAKIDLAKDLCGEIKKFAADPIGYVNDSIAGTVEGVANLALHPVKTITAIKDSVKDSFEKDVINGDAYSRSYWLTDTTHNIAKEFVGKKGAGLIPIPNSTNGIITKLPRPNLSKDPQKPEETKGTDKGKGVTETNLGNIDDFINGNKKFDEVIEDYAIVYKENVDLNKPWSWDDTIPGGDSLSSAQKRKIKKMAIEKGHIPEIKVTKADGMRYGFADFASAGVVEETVQLPERFWKLSDKEQFKWLDEQIGGTRKGMTWHHTEVPGKMELVPFGIHNITPHNGGRTKGMWADAPR